MRKRGGLTIASPKQPVRPLWARDVEETCRRIGRAIVVACALRARADQILTLDRRDFEALAPRSLIVERPLA